MTNDIKRSITATFEEIFGCKGIECKSRKMSKKQRRRNSQLQKVVFDYVKMLEDAFEATKRSTLKFD